MTLVTGTVQDIGYDGMDGTLWARPARFRSDGSVVYAPERTPYNITGGVVSAELAPGPAVLEIQVGSHARDTFEVVIPEVDTTLADLLDAVFPWEPEQVSLFVAEREAAQQAAADAETAAATATTAAQQTGQDRTAVASDKDTVVSHVQALAEPNDAAVLGLISEGADTATKAALNATYGSRSGARAVGQGELTFSATDFGAVGDGITNDTAAIQACIEAALAVIGASTGKATVTLPRGTYLVDHNLFYNVARPSGGNLTHGLTFVGDGRRSTILKLQTNGVESWFYDNMSTDTQRMAGLMFYGIGFDTDDYELGNGFKLVSKGHEKRFWFFECRFNLGTIMQTEGTGNGDLNRFFNCELYANRAWLILNNSQSVNHIFSNCLMHTLRDGIVIYQGGAIRISGGSIEMRPHATDTSDHFVVRKGAPGGLASAEDVVITGIRSEYHGDNKKLVQSYDDDMYNLKVTFRDSTFSTWRDNPRVVVRAATNTIVQFRSCFLNDAMLFEAVGSSNNDPSGALIMFEACSSGKGAPLHQRSTVVGSNARILANNCYRGSVTRSASPITPEDFDFGWDNGAPQSVTARTKTVALRRMGQRVPNPVDGYTWDLDLPSGAFIERLVVHLPQNSNRDAGTYQLHVGSGDQSIEYGSSGSGLTARDEHRIDLGGVYLNGGSLRVWATGAANQTGNGGTGVLAYMTYL